MTAPSPTRRLLDNRHAVWALVIAASIFGVIAYQKLPMQLFPDTSPPLVNVVAPWPGAGASDVAEDLARPLEEEFAALDGIASVRSVSQDNLALVTLEFRYGREATLAAVDVQNALARMGGNLPANIPPPQVLTFDTSDRPVVTFGVVADDPVRARRLAEDVFAPRLQRLPGVAAVDVFGGSVPAVLVDIDPLALEAQALPLDRVAAALRTYDVSAPAGRIRSTDADQLLRVDARGDHPDALAAVPIARPDGGRILVGELGTVTRGALDDQAMFAIDGQPAIALQVFRSDDANTVEVVAAARAEIASLSDWPGVRFLEGEESATFTEQSISNLLGNVWEALLLASTLIFLFLGRLRASAVAIVTMPLSYGITFALMHQLGVELNMVTLTAVILAVGMVVDASVVVLENIVRLRDDEGLDAADAAAIGTDEVRMPVIAGTATTIVVLVPLMYLSGFVGRVFGPLALTLLLAFLSSVVVALVLVPVLMLHTGGTSRIDAWGERLVSPFLKTVDAIRDGWIALLRSALRYRGFTMFLSLLSLAIGLAGMRIAGMDVLPKMDSGSFFVSLETPSGTSLEGTREVVAAVEHALLDQPEVILVQSQAGYEPGMRFAGGSGVMGATQGFVTATLTPRTERGVSIWEVEDRVREEIRKIPGIRTAVVRELGNTAKATTTAPVVVRLSGDDPLVLDQLGDQVLARVASVPSVVEPTRTWRRDLERLQVEVDPLRAAALGTSPAEVARHLAVGVDGIPAGDFRDPSGASEPVRVRFARADRPQVDDLLGWPLPTAGGEMALVRSLAHVRPMVDQGLVTREDLARTLDITAFVQGRPLSFALADVEAALADLELPAGYALALEGENNDLTDARGALLSAVGISVVAVYLLLVAQFRSFLHPLTVMMAVPLAISGVAAGLTLTGKPVSMPVMVGLVLLIGTVVNSSILLVEQIRLAREAGTSREEALIGAVRLRFRPIMMTSLSTIVGMIPLAAEWALGAERFSPLAIAVIGGMTTSTFLTLVVVPVMYDLLEDGKAKLAPWSAPVAAILAVTALSGGSPAQAAEAVRLDLETTVERAIANAESLDAAEFETQAARDRWGASVARFLPKVDFQAAYARLSEVDPVIIQIPLTLPTGGSPDPIQLGEVVTDTYALRANVEQPIFAGTSLIFGQKAARHGVELAEARAASAAGDVRLQAIEALVALAATRELAEVARMSERAIQAHLTTLEHMVEADRATLVDLERVRARVADAALRRVEAEASAELARLGLANAVGLPLETALEPVLPEIAPALPAAEAVALGLEQRPELVAARAGAEAQLDRSRAARGAFLPRIGVRAGWQYANPNTRYFPIEPEWRHTWDVSAVFSWTLDAGASILEARAARRDAAAAEARVSALEEGTRLAMARALQEVTISDVRVASATVAAEAASLAFDSATRTFEEGRLASADLIEREAERSAANARVVAARAEAHIIRARVDRLTGESP